LFIAGVQLPSQYLKREWKSLAYLLGPGMVAMWMCTSLIILAMVPDINILFAMVVGACLTPTDPVLANNIVKGKFADKNIPVELQRIIIAESGANDGLGYPFLFLPLLLIKYFIASDFGTTGDAGAAISQWFYDIWVYQILLGTVYGFAVGWIAKELLHFAEKRNYVDRESFLVFAIAVAVSPCVLLLLSMTNTILQLFIVGTAGMFGSDDVLACFIAGNSFTWE
jgi:sodium/hydrogen antiporter